MLPFLLRCGFDANKKTKNAHLFIYKRHMNTDLFV